jgi:CRP/FNR family transcriptional regulator
MLGVFQSERIVARPTGAGVGARTGALRRLGRAEVLFRTGDARTQLYRVERGALCHYVRDDGLHEIIEFAFPGDIIGFGHLARHTSTAQAVTETILSPVSAEEFDHLVEADGQLAARVTAAADREFDYLRNRAIESGRGKPAKRVASFLAALSRVSAMEGRDPGLVTDDIPSGAVAEHLAMSIDALAGVLRELEARGMVELAAEGLRISDMDALEKFADAA